MDPITHGALGAACAQAFLHRRDQRNAWIVGGLAAMAPDLDIFINSKSDPMLALLYHRNFTHSFLFIPLGALLVALAFMIFKRFRQHWRLTLLAAFIGYATHGLLDAFTSYGTMLFWPFSDQRISWDIVSIVDPMVTIPLVLGVAWTIIHDDQKGAFVGLFFVGLFFLFNTVQHYRALSTMQTYLAQAHLSVKRVRAFPYLASSTLWRDAAEIDSQLHIADVKTPLTQSTELKPVGIFPLFQPSDLPSIVKDSPTQMRDFRIFYWFCDSYVILAQQLPLSLADGRYLINTNPTISLWGIQFLPDQPHVTTLSFIKLEATK
ncbi:MULTISPECIES: metal-dependent hydrolase [Legionella]|uniref:Integral membrane protein n=1 Tax=Legionella drozanskii LLAP-1 TaxID=1212489 RepID=A0A0W0SS21_9GAMM|nr:MULTISPECIES: metal-dependent hydrolase [Legionella]KTC86083.1 integral membrane protein [Legionella drozanskii LLAP-1]PJE10591.1 MAG: metal-dependent hydrolase [Legionella sp.]